MAADCTWFDGAHPFIDRYGVGKPPHYSKTDLDSIHTNIATLAAIVGPLAFANVAALKTIATAHNGANWDSTGEKTRADQEAALQHCLNRASNYPRTASV